MSRWMVVNLTNTISQRVSATRTCRRACEDVEIKHRGTVSHHQLHRGAPHEGRQQQDERDTRTPAAGERGQKGESRERKDKKRSSPTGNRTRITRVTGGYTHRYTIEDSLAHRPLIERPMILARERARTSRALCSLLPRGVGCACALLVGARSLAAVSLCLRACACVATPVH